MCEEHIQIPYIGSPPPPPAPIFPEPVSGSVIRQKREGNSEAEAESDPDTGLTYRVNLDNIKEESPNKQRQLLQALLKHEAKRKAQNHTVRERQITPGVLGGALLLKSSPAHAQLSPLNPSQHLSAGEQLLRTGKGPGFLELRPKINRDHKISLEEKVQKAMIQILREDRKLGASFEKLFKASESEAQKDDRIIKALEPNIIEFPEAEVQSVLPALGGSLVSTPPPLEALPPPPSVPSHPPPVPTVTIKELHAEPGCRSFSTKTCVQVPVGNSPTFL